MALIDTVANVVDNFGTTLSADCGSGASTMTVVDATGLVAPCILTVWDAGASGTDLPSQDPNMEIVLVTLVGGTVLTITRGMQDTIAADHSTGDVVRMLPTSYHMDAIYEEFATKLSNDEDDATTGALGIGNVGDPAGGWDANLVAVYHLEEALAGATGANIYVDATGNGNQGLDYVAATGKTGQIGSGQQFTNGYIETQTFQTTLRGSFTISCWLKPDDGQPASFQTPWGTNNAANEDIVYLSLQADGRIAFWYESDNVPTRARTSAVVLANGQETWHHVACVADSTIGGVGGLKIYLDGVAQTLAASPWDGSTAGCTFALYTNVDEMFIGGRDFNGANTSPYTGYIDEWKLWSVALSAGDIAREYHSQLDPTDGQLTVKQSSDTGAMPVLRLDQSDLSEGLIDFVGSPRGVITGATNSVQSVRVELNGVVYRIPLYADA